MTTKIRPRQMDAEGIETELGELALEIAQRDAEGRPTQRAMARLNALSAELERREIEYQAETERLQAELRALVAERHDTLERVTTESTEAVLAMLLELVSVRRLLGEQVGQRLGLSRQAITLRIKPYREKLGIPRTPVVEPWWDRPYAKVATPDLLDRLAAAHAATREPSAAPEVVAIDERIKPYVTKLTSRAPTPAVEGRGRWSGKTSLAAIAADAGIGRSTLARIMGWDT